jgi:hypothetical protein
VGVTGDREAARDTTERVERLLRRVAQAGIRHLSRPVSRELVAFERSAHAAGLVHLERELGALGAEVERCLDRSHQFRASSLVDRLVRLHRRAADARQALAQPPSPADDTLLGVARRRYEPVAGTLVAQAVAATGFVSDAGFVGVTVTLVTEGGDELLATVVRPSDAFGDDPRRLWYQPVSQVTLVTLAELAHGAWRLDDVRRSSDGRLSLHAGLVAMPVPPTPRQALAPYLVPGWREATDRLAAELDDAAGVRVCVEGLRPGPCAIDETRGTATVDFTDARGATARMVVPMLPRHDVLLDNLARLRAAPPGALLGVLQAGAAGLRFEPLTAWFDAPVRVQHARVGAVQQVHLALEPLQGAVDRGRAEGRVAAAAPRDAAQALVTRVWDLVVELFSTGTAHPDALSDDLRDAARDAEALGMPGLAAGLGAVDRALATDATDAALRLGQQVRWLDRGLAVARLRDEAGDVAHAPSPRRGADRRVWPLGVVRDGAKVLVVALDAADGSPLLVRDEWGGRGLPAVPGAARPRGGPAPRVVFHRSPARPDPRRPRAAARLAHRPDAGRRGRRRAPAARGPAGRGARAARRWRPRPGPDGWRLFVGDEPLPAELSLEAELHLDKGDPGPQRFVGTFAVVGGAVRLLAVDGVVPEVEPGHRRWSWALVVSRARGGPLEGVVAGLGWASGGSPIRAPDPAPEVVRREAAAMLAQARKNARAGEGLPKVEVAVGWGALAGGRRPPASALGLEVLVRRAIVRPLARWLAGGGRRGRGGGPAVGGGGGGVGAALPVTARRACPSRAPQPRPCPSTLERPPPGQRAGSSGRRGATLGAPLHEPGPGSLRPRRRVVDRARRGTPPGRRRPGGRGPGGSTPPRCAARPPGPARGPREPSRRAAPPGRPRPAGPPGPGRCLRPPRACRRRRAARTPSSSPGWPPTDTTWSVPGTRARSCVAPRCSCSRSSSRPSVRWRTTNEPSSVPARRSGASGT